MKALVIKTVDRNMKAHNGFIWPESGPVECPDWNDRAKCGNGLHGLLWGKGNGRLLDWSDDAKWLVVAVVADDCIDLNGKVKFPRGEVVHCGDRESALAALVESGASLEGVVGSTLTGGYHSTLTGGDYSIFIIHRWVENQKRVFFAYVGEDGIKPGTPYHLDDDGKFVEVVT